MLTKKNILSKDITPCSVFGCHNPASVILTNNQPLCSRCAKTKLAADNRDRLDVTACYDLVDRYK